MIPLRPNSRVNLSGPTQSVSILLLYIASATTPVPFVYTAKQYRSYDPQSAAGQLAPPQSRYSNRSIQPVLKPSDDLYILSPNQIFSLCKYTDSPFIEWLLFRLFISCVSFQEQNARKIGTGKICLYRSTAVIGLLTSVIPVSQ